MENSNTTITTAGGYTIEFRQFLTGRQARHIKDAFLEDVTLTGTAEKGSKPVSTYSLKGTKANIAQDRAIEAVVAKIDGPGVDPAKSVLDNVLDLPEADFNEVTAKVEEITADKKKEVNSPTT